MTATETRDTFTTSDFTESDGKLVCCASDLGWRRLVPRSIWIGTALFHLIARDRTDGELSAWSFQSASGRTAIIFND